MSVSAANLSKESFVCQEALRTSLPPSVGPAPWNSSILAAWRKPAQWARSGSILLVVLSSAALEEVGNQVSHFRCPPSPSPAGWQRRSTFRALSTVREGHW